MEKICLRLRAEIFMLLRRFGSVLTNLRLSFRLLFFFNDGFITRGKSYGWIIFKAAAAFVFAPVFARCVVYIYCAVVVVGVRIIIRNRCFRIDDTIDLQRFPIRTDYNWNFA